MARSVDMILTITIGIVFISTSQFLSFHSSIQRILSVAVELFAFDFVGVVAAPPAAPAAAPSPAAAPAAAPAAPAAAHSPAAAHPTALLSAVSSHVTLSYTGVFHIAPPLLYKSGFFEAVLFVPQFVQPS